MQLQHTPFTLFVSYVKNDSWHVKHVSNLYCRKFLNLQENYLFKEKPFYYRTNLKLLGHNMNII